MSRTRQAVCACSEVVWPHNCMPEQFAIVTGTCGRSRRHIGYSYMVSGRCVSLAGMVVLLFWALVGFPSTATAQRCDAILGHGSNELTGATVLDGSPQIVADTRCSAPATVACNGHGLIVRWVMTWGSGRDSIKAPCEARTTHMLYIPWPRTGGHHSHQEQSVAA